MKLTLDPNQCGIGDVVTAAWIAQGANAEGHDVAFQPGGYDALVRMLGQRVEASEAPVQIATTHDSLFNAELRVRGKREARPLEWQRYLPIRVTPRRPPVTVDHEAEAWASKQRREWMKASSAPLVLIFPGCNFTTRRWSLHKFLRVADELTRAGWVVAAMDSSPAIVGRFPYFLAGCPFEQIAAMMRVADCVLANDSGPAHLAGTIGTRTFAVMGPTRSEIVFGHCPEIEGLRATRQRCVCVGCHFEPERGYSGICDTGCEALAALQPAEVAERLDEWHRLGRAA